MKQKIATIFGASGFIGRHLIRRLTEKDFRVVAATRSPYLHGYLKPLGNPGQIDLEKVNLFDEENLRTLIKNSDVVMIPQWRYHDIDTKENWKHAEIYSKYIK